MTVEQVALVTALITGLEKVGSWPVWSVLAFMLVGPWVLSLVLSYHSQKRFESVVGMYENNVLLVSQYNTHAEQLTEIITLSIQVQTRLVEKIEKNMFCPMIRDKGPQ